MRKLKLEVEALRVESFDTTTTGRREPGTVRGHQEAVENDREEVAITTPQTRDRSCFGTCAVSCFGSCGASCDNLCTYGCSDGCTRYTCPSGGEICCA